MRLFTFTLLSAVVIEVRVTPNLFSGAGAGLSLFAGVFGESVGVFEDGLASGELVAVSEFAVVVSVEVLVFGDSLGVNGQLLLVMA